MRLRSFRLPRLSLSIKARIAALSLVPLIAFGVIAATTWIGQTRVDEAVAAFQQQASTARLALSMRAEVVTMLYEARRLAQTREPDAAKEFQAAAGRFGKNFSTLKDLSVADRMASARFAPIDSLVRQSNTLFATLITTVADLGSDEKHGRTKDLEAAAAKVEGLLAADGGHQAALLAFQGIRQLELQMRIAPASASATALAAKVKELQEGTVVALLPGEARDAVRTALDTYAKIFQRWADDIADIVMQSMQIEAKFATLLSTLEGFRSNSEFAQSRATDALDAAKLQVLVTVLAAIGIAAVLTALLSFLVGRSITNPLGRLSATMQRPWDSPLA